MGSEPPPFPVLYGSWICMDSECPIVPTEERPTSSITSTPISNKTNLSFSPFWEEPLKKSRPSAKEDAEKNQTERWRNHRDLDETEGSVSDINLHNGESFVENVYSFNHLLVLIPCRPQESWTQCHATVTSNHDPMPLLFIVFQKIQMSFIMLMAPRSKLLQSLRQRTSHKANQWQLICYVYSKRIICTFLRALAAPGEASDNMVYRLLTWWHGWWIWVELMFFLWPKMPHSMISQRGASIYDNTATSSFFCEDDRLF